MIERLDNDNFVMYCMKHYDNPQCHDIEEFHEDLRRIKYIKKLITRYTLTNELKERLILNHLIILNNVFGPEHLSRILFLRMEKQMGYLKPFLILLNILPDKVFNIGKNGKTIVTDEVAMDENIIEALRKI